MDTEILIVGAGPTGLVAACQLLRFGIRFRIIDKLKDRLHESRAFALQAKSMEIFQNLGISSEFLKIARSGIDFAFFINGKKQIEINFDNFPHQNTPFPSVYFLPQNEIEGILIHFLEKKGIYIERGKELLLFSQNEKGIEAVIKENATGQIENLHCAYLLGCDGAHSTIRHILNFSFEGGSYKQSFILADATINWPFSRNKFLFFLNKQGIFIHIPLTKIFSRIILTQRIDTVTKKSSTPTITEIENAACLITRNPIKLSNAIWLTQFRLHHRGVQSYSHKRVFLAGDAAHIHSPVGGQGMNTGIQDVTNLAWKLALVLKKSGSTQLLNTYEIERHRIGKILLKTTDRFFYFITTKNFFISQLRTFLLPLILSFLFSKKNLEKRLFRFISQLNIHYHKNKFFYENTKAADPTFIKGPRAGYRAPDAPLANSTLFTLFKEKPIHLLYFKNEEANTICLERLNNLKNIYHEWLQSHLFIASLATQALFNRYGVTQSAIYIIRPDGYIGFRSFGSDLTSAENYLKNLFQKTRD